MAKSFLTIIVRIGVPGLITTQVSPIAMIQVHHEHSDCHEMRITLYAYKSVTAIQSEINSTSSWNKLRFAEYNFNNCLNVVGILQAKCGMEEGNIAGRQPYNAALLWNPFIRRRHISSSDLHSSGSNLQEKKIFYFSSPHFRNKLIDSLPGDKEQPILKIRGNRAFLCKWRTNSNIPMGQLLALGMTKDADPFEVCSQSIDLACEYVCRMYVLYIT